MDAVSSMTFALLYVIHTHCFVESLLLFWLGRQAKTINGISKAFGKYACIQKEVTSKDNEGRHTKRLIKFYWKRSFGRVTRACNFGFIHYIKVHRKKSSQAKWKCRAADRYLCKNVPYHIFPILDLSGRLQRKKNQLTLKIKREYIYM